MDFGTRVNTWWSRKWLDTLLESADEQAVKQGLKFVERGQVTSIDIIDNRVISVVKGPNGGIHNNYIVFPKFKDEKADVFMNLLMQQPAEMLALKNGAMNPPLELLLAKSGLTLFDSIADVKMGCDCRDPVPCKYIVATFVKIAEQADSSPNLLFKLHGLDLEAYREHHTLETNLEAPQEQKIVRALGGKSKIFEQAIDNRLDFAEDSSDSLFANSQASVTRTPRQILPQFDFDSWKDYSRILPAMLPNYPKFCPAGNFRKSFTDELEGCRKFFANYENFDQFLEHYRVNNSKTFIAENEALRIYHKNGWRWHFDHLNEGGNVIETGLSVPQVMGAVSWLGGRNLSWHHYTACYLFLLLKVAFHLVRTGAIYPQVFWTHKDVAQVRWLPAEMLPDILGIVADLEAAAPQKFAFTAREEDFVEMAEPAEQVLSLFISQLLRFAHTYKPALKTNHGNLLSFFFTCVSGRLAGNMLSVPAGIQKWFSVYSSLDFRTQLLFKCYESGEQVALEVFVIDTDKLTPLSTLFEENDARLLSILNILNGIADSFKPMGTYIENRAASPIMMQGAVLLQFLQDCLKKLEIFGIKTEIPKNLMNVGKPKPKIRLQGSMSFGAFTANDLLDFDWEVAIGDENVSAEEFLELAENADGLLKYKSQYVEVSAEDLQRIREQIEGRAKGDKGAKDPDAEGAADSENAGKDGAGSAAGDESADGEPIITQAKLVQACFTGECDGIPVDMAGEFKQQFDSWRSETEVALPEHLNATMRPYQVRGYSWMYKNLEIGFGCILADDMGLGKTLQVIAFLLKMHEEGKLAEKKALVVLPAGLLCNWQVEIKKFAPDLTFFAYHGGSRDLEKFHADVLLTTYATFRKDFDELNEREWQVIVIDEAQNIKNADSEQSKLLRRMRAPMKIAMSGTPVENRLMEFWTIMDFANRGFFPSAAEFREKFETPIQKMGNEKVAETFRKITAPFMLRRLKTDKSIISDLPDKIIQDEYAELTKPQAALYQKTLEHFMQELEMEQALSEKANDAHALFKRKGIILQMILALKQICNHPATFLKGAAAASQEKVAEPAEATPALSSGKMQMLLDLLTSIQEQGEKTLIFTQFAEMGFLLEKTITEELGLRTHFYHGGCTQTQRTSMIEDFQKNPECKVLILSLKAGGTGLNLTAASQVIHYDLWWNPAIEAQATDRAFRIGQTRNVQVHRFITKGTFEEKINALLETKKSIANMTVSAGETWLADMDDKQLGEVFGLDNTLV
ncbi:SNF2-related protein [Fibrobacter sp. UBA3629]|uniref:SNF2-related protein n=1 Tax=Fibrobacter sp. UBA3629 TaxID=1946530 RepID=UPI0025C6E760|nr:SNF2-related protein [Fibrobacter sp. UBA3629]